MAKVLKTSRSETVTYRAADGSQYIFFNGDSNPDCKGMELIKDDSHAAQLLERYPDELSVVPDSEVPEKYKQNVADFISSVTTEAAAKYPLLKEKILGKQHKPKGT